MNLMLWRDFVVAQALNMARSDPKAVTKALSTRNFTDWVAPA
jgi:hypothetical protein